MRVLRFDWGVFIISACVQPIFSTLPLYPQVRKEALDDDALTTMIKGIMKRTAQYANWHEQWMPES